MLVNREKLLLTLKVASCGACMPPRMVSLEQSDQFIFTEGSLISFNDEIMVRAPSPLDFETIVHAADFLKVLGKFPDKEIEITQKKGELIIKGKRRDSGIATQKEIKLPFGEIPGPGEWTSLKEGTTGMLKQAARGCGKDLANPLTTVVHAGPDRIQACDNFRIFRATLQTGFPKEVLIPAYALSALESIPLNKISITKGWCHFRTAGKIAISVRLMKDDYAPVTQAIDGMIKIKDTEVVYLPDNLAEMIDRAEVMKEGSDPLVHIKVADDLLTLRSQKDSGWYKERKKIAYKGRPLNFQANPKFLVDLLQRTTKVRVGAEKMKVKTKDIECVITLEAMEAENV